MDFTKKCGGTRLVNWFETNISENVYFFFQVWFIQFHENYVEILVEFELVNFIFDGIYNENALLGLDLKTILNTWWWVS